MIKHTDIADPKSIVPALHGALNVSDQFFSLKRAERKGILQPLAKYCRTFQKIAVHGVQSGPSLPPHAPVHGRKG